MAYAKTLIFLLTIWATSNFILAQEGSGQGEPGSGSIHTPGIHAGPNEGIKNERQSTGFGQIPFFGSIPGFGSFFGSGSFLNSGSIPQSGSIPGLNSFSGFGLPFFGGSNGVITDAPNLDVTRSKRSPQDKHSGSHEVGIEDEEDRAEEGPQSRLFFSSLFNTRFTTCNYTTQAGTTCGSCRQVLTCFRSNVGKLKTCKKFFPYCNNGRCSLFPGSACSSGSATTAATATTATATTATDATTVTTT